MKRNPLAQLERPLGRIRVGLPRRRQHRYHIPLVIQLDELVKDVSAVDTVVEIDREHWIKTFFRHRIADSEPQCSAALWALGGKRRGKYAQCTDTSGQLDKGSPRLAAKQRVKSIPPIF